MLKRHFGVSKYSRKHLHSYQRFQILKDFLTVMNAIVVFIKTLTFLKNYYSCMNLRKALLANVRFLRQRGWGITTWIMEFIGKRSHKKAVREWGCVRSIGRTTRSQESSLRCAALGWRGIFCRCYSPTIMFASRDATTLCSFKYRWLASKDFKVVKFHRDFKFKS